MKILHVTPYYAPAYAFGGVVRAVEGMARALARQGHAVTVLTTDALDHATRSTGPMDEIRDGVRVIRVPNLSHPLRARLNLSTPPEIRHAAQRLLPEMDVVHCHEFRTVENLLVLPIAERLGKLTVLSPHGTLTQATGRSGLKRTWDRLLSPGIAQRIQHVIGLTPQEIETVAELWPTFGRRMIPTLFSVIPNGIDPEDFVQLPAGQAFRARHNLGDGPLVLFMGRLHPRKGVDVLVRAFQQANIAGARLVIAGPDEGMLETLRPLLDERTIVTGYLDGNERLAALAAADVFALPATGEGFSMAVLEALGAGLPVILSPGCNFPEAAASGAGLEVAAQVVPLAAALHTLLSDGPRRIAMGQHARQLIHEHYTWDAIAAQLTAVYAAHLSPA